MPTVEQCRRVVPLLAASLVCVIASAASAEGLPGNFEVTAGGHFMVNVHEWCQPSSDVVACGELWTFAGFDLAAHARVGPPWLSLGVRASGSSALDRDQESAGTEHDFWLWRGSLEARFDVPIWPRALWIAAELGAVASVSSTKSRLQGTSLVLASGEVVELAPMSTERSRTTVGVLAGLAVGWDFWLFEPVLLGLEARVQLLTIGHQSADGSESSDAEFPFVAIGVHAGYRW